jgi:hypothetical protein
MPEEDLNIVEISDRSIEEKIKDFSELLKDIESLDDKKRKLWREIYENAVTDRQNSYVMFSKLAKICGNDTTQHAVHGKTIATFLERMSRSNDQLLKLADLIAAERANEGRIDPDAMFDQISQTSKKGR